MSAEPEPQWKPIAIPAVVRFECKELINIIQSGRRQEPMPIREPFQELRCLPSMDRMEIGESPCSLAMYATKSSSSFAKRARSGDSIFNFP